ncbi:MAG: response regulator [Agathobacter sp.]
MNNLVGMVQKKKWLKMQDNLIKALSMPYENVYVVNMKTREGICYRMGQTMSDRYGKKFAAGNYEQSILVYIENDVLEEDRYLFDEVRTIEGVEELLSDKQMYSFSYRVFRNDLLQYFQCQIVKPSRERGEFAIAFKNIDEEKKQELLQQRKIEDALAKVEKINETLRDEMEIAGALSKDYQDVVLLDLTNDTATTIKRAGVILAEEERVLRRSYSDTWDYYILKYVVEEDREALYAAIDREVVQKKLEKSDEYIFNYRVRYDETGIHYFQVVFLRMFSRRAKEGRIILGFRNVDTMVEEERKRTKAIEAQSEIIEGLGSDYYSVLLVNPTTDLVSIYRAKSEDGHAIAKHFDRNDYCWSKGICSYAKDQVSDKFREEFVEKLSLERMRAGGEDYSFIYEKLTEGKSIYLQARVAFVQEKDGGFVAVIGTRNVDELIRREQEQEMALQEAYDAAEAANKAKTAFLSNMSHDIRTPMNGIIGMTAIAAAHIDDKERVQDCLQKITLASKHLLSLINEVLDMSKIESGKVELVEEEFNLSDLVDNLLTMTNAQLAEHHHELSVNISGVTHEAVIGDSLRIQKVFTNLMGNAVKFTPDGGKIRLTILERPCNQAKVGCYEFIFEDNGIGMSEEFLEQIFEPFARAVDGRVNKIQGTGLGMPIARNIVHMMGGDIKVESKEGVGSRFTVTIYLKLQDTIQEQYDKFIDLHVLVADDDPLSLESCCCILNDFGMKAEGVSNGRKAVEQVVLRHEQKQDYYACIIDWKMPEMDGIETTRAIRKAVGDEVPIIIISAYDWSDIEQEARAAGANAFISKPLFGSRLARAFNTLISGNEIKEADTTIEKLEEMNLSGYRALLVEDNELNTEIATELLEMTGIKVECAPDGTDAVDKIIGCEDGYYDIILMDIQMPKMNGYDATRAIRAMNRNYCRKVPIIAMTANAFAEDVLAAKTVGMNEHIAKPLDLNILYKTLKKWIG